MAFTENYRHRYLIKKNNGQVVDSGFELVQYDDRPEVWEPVDTILARGANGPTKRITKYVTIGEGETGITPLNGNVFYPKTGTAAV